MAEFRRDGTVWRMQLHRRTARGGVQSKSGNTTLTAADRGSHLVFTAAATLTLLAAATAKDDFEFTVECAPGSSGNVTIDANSTETISGVQTRTLYPGDRVSVICDGSNWHTRCGTPYKYVSPNQAFSSGGTTTLAHGLGRRPTSIEVELICVTAQHGYTAGDVIAAPINWSDSGTTYGLSVTYDATNLTIRQSNTAGVYKVLNKSTGADGAITNANWEFRIVAYE